MQYIARYGDVCLLSLIHNHRHRYYIHRYFEYTDMYIYILLVSLCIDILYRSSCQFPQIWPSNLGMPQLSPRAPTVSRHSFDPDLLNHTVQKLIREEALVTLEHLELDELWRVFGVGKKHEEPMFGVEKPMKTHEEPMVMKVNGRITMALLDILVSWCYLVVDMKLWFWILFLKVRIYRSRETIILSIVLELITSMLMLPQNERGWTVHVSIVHMHVDYITKNGNLWWFNQQRERLQPKIIRGRGSVNKLPRAFAHPNSAPSLWMTDAWHPVPLNRWYLAGDPWEVPRGRLYTQSLHGRGGQQDGQQPGRGHEQGGVLTSCCIHTMYM